jgi:glutathione S-transferase
MPSLLPNDDKGFARALALDAWAGTELFRRVCHPLFHNQVVQPVLRKQPGDRAAIDFALQEALPKALGYLEGLADKSFLVGDALSIADLAVTSNLLMFHYLGAQSRREPLSKPRTLLRYAARIAHYFPGAERRETVGPTDGPQSARARRRGRDFCETSVLH